MEVKYEDTALSKQMNQTRKKIEAMDLFEKSLDSNANYLTNDTVQQEYYRKIEYYLSLLKDEKLMLKFKKKRFQLNKKTICNRRGEYSDCNINASCSKKSI